MCDPYDSLNSSFSFEPQAASTPIRCPVRSFSFDPQVASTPIRCPPASPPICCPAVSRHSDEYLDPSLVYDDSSTYNSGAYYMGGGGIGYSCPPAQLQICSPPPDWNQPSNAGIPDDATRVLRRIPEFEHLLGHVPMMDGIPNLEDILGRIPVPGADESMMMDGIPNLGNILDRIPMPAHDQSMMMDGIPNLGNILDRIPMPGADESMMRAYDQPMMMGGIPNLGNILGQMPDMNQYSFNDSGSQYGYGGDMNQYSFNEHSGSQYGYGEGMMGGIPNLGNLLDRVQIPGADESMGMGGSFHNYSGSAYGYGSEADSSHDYSGSAYGYGSESSYPGYSTQGSFMSGPLAASTPIRCPQDSFSDEDETDAELEFIQNASDLINQTL